MSRDGGDYWEAEKEIERQLQQHPGASGGGLRQGRDDVDRKVASQQASARERAVATAAAGAAMAADAGVTRSACTLTGGLARPAPAARRLLVPGCRRRRAPHPRAQARRRS